jgi:HEAT repeat protein
MQKRGRVLLLAALLVALAALVALFALNPEPRYQGRHLSEWILLYWEPDTPDADKTEAAEAIRAIGTNAVPDLVKWLPFKEPTAHARLRLRLLNLPILLPKRVREPLAVPPMLVRSLSAVSGFRALGTNAVSAIPALAVLARDSDPTAATSFLAIQALAGIGDVALPALTNNLTSLLANRRAAIAQVLGEKIHFGNNPSLRLPPLLACLQDHDPLVAAAAATSLGDLALDPDSVIPALQSAADNHGVPTVRLPAIEAIGKFGPTARAAAPFLVRALASTKADEARAGATALRRVAPEMLTNAPPQW